MPTFCGRSDEGEVGAFRSVLAEVKAELYPDLTDESLCFTRDEAEACCAGARRRLKASRLTRPFILKGLVSIRKHRKLRRREPATA